MTTNEARALVNAIDAIRDALPADEQNDGWIVALVREAWDYSRGTSTYAEVKRLADEAPALSDWDLEQQLKALFR